MLSQPYAITPSLNNVQRKNSFKIIIRMQALGICFLYQSYSCKQQQTMPCSASNCCVHFLAGGLQATRIQCSSTWVLQGLQQHDVCCF